MKFFQVNTGNEFLTYVTKALTQQFTLKNREH